MLVLIFLLLFVCLSETKGQTGELFLHVPWLLSAEKWVKDSCYEAKTAKISNFWIFWPVIHLIDHLLLAEL